MADIYTIMRRLEKGKDVEANLSLFSNHMMNSANRLSYSRFALNYPTFYETYMEMKKRGDKIPDIVTDAVKELNRIVRKYVGTRFSGELFEQSIEDIETLRKKNIEAMKLFTAYTDRYTIYEYVLNRMEYRFKETKMECSDENLKTEILNYLTMDKDNAVRQTRTIQIIEQLPMRMTKSKFFQILQDGLSVYIGSEKQSVKDLIYMLRTAAMMEEPEGMEDAYPEIYHMIYRMSQVDFKTLTAESYEALEEEQEKTSQVLNYNIDLYMLLEELTNDLYVILLSTPYAIVDLKEKQNCETIIREVCDLFNQQTELPEHLSEYFEKIEGIQERCADLFHSGESMLEEIQASYREILSGSMLDKIYCSLERMSKLLSTSLYVELENSNADHSQADRDYVMQAYAVFSTELKEHLKKQSKPVARAIMAKLITLLPLFVTTYQELENYIETSLASCSDLAEKAACVEIIRTMMSIF
ncbi:hypothetical protein NDGK_02806 [Clostridiales bacterium CHKCI001]|nr:hypothetical protein NDGK_02806 [Clostridiales bacterium CHKCI001]